MPQLLFQAVALPDGKIIVPPPFLADGAASQPSDGAADLEVELLDAAGASLVRRRVAWVTPCAPAAGSGAGAQAPARIAQALLPYDASAVVLRVSQWGRVVHERVAKRPPEVKITWPTAKALAGPKAALSWTCPTGETCHGLLQYSHDGERWQSLSLPQPPGRLPIDARYLPGGPECRLRLLVSDGLHTHRFDGKPFALKPRGWVAMILRPADRAVLEGGAVELVGQGFEVEARLGEFEALAWRSSLDGELGRGHRLHAALSRGKHEITLSARGAGLQTIQVEVP